MIIVEVVSMYDYEKVARDMDVLKEDFKNKYEFAFKKLTNNIANKLYDVSKRNGYKINIERITDNIIYMLKEYSKYKKFMIDLVDLISNAKKTNWTTEHTEYEIDQIKQRMKRISLPDAFSEIKRDLVRLSINSRMLEEIIYDTKNSFNKLCDEVTQLNEELINETKTALNRNIININNNQQLPTNISINNDINNTVSNNDPISFRGIDFESVKRRCTQAFEMVRNGQMTTEQTIAFLENEFSIQAPDDIMKLIVNLEWELPANNKELSEFLKTKKEEIKSIISEKNKKDELSSAFL